MLTAADWIAVATVAVPLIAKAFTDWQANAVANHNAALARIAGMAARQAGTIARTLLAAPPGSDVKALEASLIEASARQVITEMTQSVRRVGGSLSGVASMVQGEVDKALVP